jgi:hypothetical protein
MKCVRGCGRESKVEVSVDGGRIIGWCVECAGWVKKVGEGVVREIEEHRQEQQSSILRW